MAYVDPNNSASTGTHKNTSNSSHLQIPNGNGSTSRLPLPRNLDEMADSAARKVVMFYGPGNNPRYSESHSYCQWTGLTDVLDCL